MQHRQCSQENLKESGEYANIDADEKIIKVQRSKMENVDWIYLAQD
jgi:hypothetical protein